MEVKNWVSAGYIKADKIQTGMIVAHLGEFSGEVRIGHLVGTAINFSSVQATGAAFGSLSVGGSGLSKKSVTIDDVTINYWGY